MTHAMKGLLLSALVLPGLGQMALERRRRGVLFMIAVLVGIVVFVVYATRQALRMVDAIDAGGGVVDQEAIARAAAQATASSHSLGIQALIAAIMICWVYSAVDAYRIGKQQDLREANEHRS